MDVPQAAPSGWVLAGRLLVSLAIAAAVMTPLWLWGGVDRATLEMTWSRLTLTAWLPAFALHAFLYVVRSWRFAVLMPADVRPPQRQLLPVCAAHTLATFVLPAKTGEATFVLYSGRTSGVPAPAAVAALVVSRILDMASVFLGLGVACVAMHVSGSWPAVAWFLPAGLVLLVLAAAGFALAARGDSLVAAVGWFVRVLRLSTTKPGQWLLTRADAFAVALRQAGSPMRLASACALSLLAWLVIFLFCAILARGLGIGTQIGLAEATFGSALAMVTSLVPLSAFANFGTFEAGWVGGFGLLGVDRDTAVATGVGLHVVQLVHVVFLGVLGHIGMALYSRRT
ncbi:MAG: hypothetical protein RIT40_1937 [Planctomycetota bacterium]|jgi:uncharacterized membrane protein YbhN (UPF0104 family)